MARYPIKQMLHKLNYFIIKQEVVKCLLWREIIMQAKQSAKESHMLHKIFYEININIKFLPLTN